MFCRVCCTELAGCLPSPEPCWRLLATSRLPAPLLGSAMGKRVWGFDSVGAFPPTQKLLFPSLAGFRLRGWTWGLEGADGARDISLELALRDFLLLE